MLPLAAKVTGAARENASAQLAQRLAPRATGSVAVVRRGHHREHRPDDVPDVALPPLGPIPPNMPKSFWIRGGSASM